MTTRVAINGLGRIGHSILKLVLDDLALSSSRSTIWSTPRISPLLRFDTVYERYSKPNERLSLTEGGNVRCALKTPYRDGTTHVIFEPEDFIARLAALVPKPRAHQIRYHGVFAPASPDRARVVPRTRAAVASECGEASVTDQQRALTWAQRLKRAFAIDIETCRRCGGRLRVIASIEAPTTIERILAHLGRDAEPVDPAYPSRAPPQGEFSF